ncbi:hypothetical protein Mpet_1129 [Methanolacinia petrolearia DSM 11571]|uniref:SMODS and SLOG-associating 2TM effector domain-containing protein n=1 Tax=Methanolacinia petrolearia (strain DSM 11571 / OCM 486 / SEBR 4847) TaxID=679926 RepID=E1RCZ5_METP4|nr:hypothetical protein [Methanolacinia petrolearia]ADN35895.1 hypothetical protein Mpet_1129 [Methanolacinia petrolearia DSM 11571]
MTLLFAENGSTNVPESESKIKENAESLPQSLPVTVNIGLFLKPGDLGSKSAEALDQIIHRLNSLLSHTPHNFRFLLPLSCAEDFIIVEEVRTSVGREVAAPDLVLFTYEGVMKDSDCPAGDAMKYDIRSVSPGRTAYGYDPLSIAVMENSNLVVIIGEEKSLTSSGKNPDVLAERYGRTAVFIDQTTGNTREFQNDDRIFDTFRCFDTYNNERVSRKKFLRKKEEYVRALKADFSVAGLKEEIIEPSYEHLLPHYIKAKILGRKYRSLYFMKGILISLLSALAVFTIALQTLFFPDQSFLVWVEVVEIIIIIALMAGSRIGNYHIKWIDYNFLSERIRSAFFIGILCMTCSRKEDLPPMTPLRTPNDWMALAFETIISTGQATYCSRETDFEPLKKFFTLAWINKRLAHYEKEAENARLRYRSLALSGEFLFSFTLILAVAHALGVGHWETFFNAEVPLLMAFLTITLPAFGAAISAIRVHGEYNRNSDRYSHIVRHLTAIKTEMKYISGLPELCALVKEVNEMTFREVHDWKVIFRYANIEGV